jgi:hypothetical protein
MAHQPQHDLLTVLGWVQWGDLGALTLYRNRRGKMVAYAKTWPHKPPSPLQTIQRQRITDAAAAWQALTADQRAQWELATKRASLAMCGYCLWVAHQLTPDAKAIETLERQTNTELLP